MTEPRGLARLLPVLALAPPMFGAAIVLGRIAGMFAGAEPRGEELPMAMGEIRLLADAMRAGDTSGWIHGANLGYPVGVFTPIVPSLVAALLSLTTLGVVGATKLCLAASLVLLPITCALGLRAGGLSPWRASLAGFACAMIASLWEFGAGVDGAFRAGLLPQTMALAVLPLACGVGVRAIGQGRGGLAAIALAALVLLCEPIQTIGVLVCWGVALAAARDRAALTNALALVLGLAGVTAFCWLPALAYADVYGGGPRNAPGARLTIEGAIVTLVGGDGIDLGRAPWLTALGALAVVITVVRWRFFKLRDARLGLVFVLQGALLWLAVAPPGLPDDALPAGRVVVLAQLAWASLAAVALVDVAELVWNAVQPRPLRVMLAVSYAVALVGLGSLLDASAERALRKHVGTTDSARGSERVALAGILEAIEMQPQPWGRVAAIGEVGFLPRMLPAIALGAPPLWASAGAPLAASPNAWLAHKDDVARFRSLYNIRFFLTPLGARPPARLQLATAGPYALWVAEGGGMWLPVIPGRVVEGDVRAWREAVRAWASSASFDSFLLYGVEPAAAPTMKGALGRVDVIDAREDRSRFVADVIVEAEGARMLALKESYSPFWRATVDGVSARVWRVSPDFPAVEVPPGQHQVQLEVVRPWWNWLLLFLSPGAWALGALFVRRRAELR